MEATVTGGLGFIGSHLVDRLVARGDSVRVIDDASTGRLFNLNPAAEFLSGDVSDSDAAAEAVEGAEVVFHLAAHRAVLRSVERPLETDTANSHGTLTVLEMSRRSGVRRVVSASSSSVYGGVSEVPTSESAVLAPRSPYAVTKVAGEHYCQVFAELYGLETVSLRYFNVFGPRQRPDSAYAAVIPLFIDALRSGTPPVVHGDGLQSRNFTYVDDAVEANIAAARALAGGCSGRAFNIAGPSTHTILDLLGTLERITGVTADPVHTDPRPGDIRHSWADTSAAADSLGWEPRTSFESGLAKTVSWSALSEAPGADRSAP